MEFFSDPDLRKKADLVGASGWVIPFQLAPGNVRLLLEDIQLDTQRDIDSMFIQFYDDWLLLPRVFRSLQSEPYFMKYSTLISQSISAYNTKSFALVVSSLVSVIEGLVSELTGDVSGSMKKKLQLIDQVAQADVGILTAPVLLSLSSFLKSLYAYSDFPNPQPSALNRHWINHGRAEVPNEEADALRIINAINCVGYGIKYFGHSES